MIRAANVAQKNTPANLPSSAPYKGISSPAEFEFLTVDNIKYAVSVKIKEEITAEIFKTLFLLLTATSAIAGRFIKQFIKQYKGTFKKAKPSIPKFLLQNSPFKKTEIKTVITVMGIIIRLAFSTPLIPYADVNDTKIITATESTGKSAPKTFTLKSASNPANIPQTDIKEETKTATLKINGRLNIPLFIPVKPPLCFPKRKTIKKQKVKIKQEAKSGKIKFSVPKNETNSLPDIKPAPIIEPIVTETTEIT